MMRMPDATSISIVLAATAAATVAAHLRRVFKRWMLQYRLGRSLRVAVRRENARDLSHGFAGDSVPGPGDEDMAA